RLPGGGVQGHPAIAADPPVEALHLSGEHGASASPASIAMQFLEPLFQQCCVIVQILLTLLDPALVAGLVLGTTQLVRAGMAEGLGVYIAGIAPDGILDMAALRLGGL